MRKSRVVWRGDKQVIRNMQRYGDAAKEAVLALLRRWEREIEAYAKQTAKWTDRTGNARQNLFSWVDTDGNTIRLYLSHRVDYGLWLEVRWAGRWAVILPTLQAHETRIMDSVRRLFR